MDRERHGEIGYLCIGPSQLKLRGFLPRHFYEHEAVRERNLKFCCLNNPHVDAHQKRLSSGVPEPGAKGQPALRHSIISD
jgi:hypothetical protein